MRKIYEVNIPIKTEIDNFANDMHLSTILDYLDTYMGEAGYTLVSDDEREEYSCIGKFVSKDENWNTDRCHALAFEEDDDICELLYLSDSATMKWCRENEDE